MGVCASCTGGNDGVIVGMSMGEDFASVSMTVLPDLNLTDFLGLVFPVDGGFCVKASSSSSFVVCLFSL
jgi:hypothetical protein